MNFDVLSYRFFIVLFSFALDCAVAAKWKNFVGLLAAPSLCYCCLTAVITDIVIMVIIISSLAHVGN